MNTIKTGSPAKQLTLRPRRQKEEKKKTYVKRAVLVIERDGRLTSHEIYFDRDQLPLDEMYRLGFLGDLDLDRPDGTTEEAEVEAGPADTFDGDAVGRFAFQVRFLTGEAVPDAHVVKFNFEKQ